MSVTPQSPSRIEAEWSTVWIDKVVKLLGQGTFGKVVHAVDTKSSTDARTGRKREVAVKVIRAVQKCASSPSLLVEAEWLTWT